MKHADFPLPQHDRTQVNRADMLADIRREIRTLQASEARLRADLLAARPDTEFTGRRAKAVVETQRIRQFDKDLLPEAIRNDPRYWVTKSRVYVRTVPLDEGMGDRPEWGAAPSGLDTQSPDPDLGLLGLS